MVVPKKMRTAINCLALIVLYHLVMKVFEANQPSHNVIYGSSSQTKVNCDQEIHLLVILPHSTACKDFSELLKTILHYRQSAIHLHLITNLHTDTVISQLLRTWELPHVIWKTITHPDLNDKGDGLSQVLLSYVTNPVPDDVKQVIYLNNKMRLLTNIEKLWQHFEYFNKEQSYGVLYTTSQASGSDGIAVLLMDRLRMQTTNNSDRPRYQMKSKDPVKTAFEVYGDPYLLPCAFAVQMKDPSKHCQSMGDIKGIFWTATDNHFSNNVDFEQAKQRLETLLSGNGDIYRDLPGCTVRSTESADIQMSGKCAEYRYAETMKRRTHLYYIGDKRSASDPHDIALLTQFTIDRFHVFERFMLNWEGPVHAVMYVTDEEALKLPTIIASTEGLRHRTNIAYHLVFKRGKFYPINYLRNVAVKETKEAYQLFVDVDLVVNNGIYSKLKAYIKNDVSSGGKFVMVVAAFEALENLSELPQNRSSLLRLIGNKKVVGYRMNRGWNLGHKPTNYPKWLEDDRPYEALWRDAYEPYMVLRTSEAPLFREILLERMGDKIAYGREIHARGFRFLVLPDVFVLHLPHPTSAGTNMWMNYSGYARCGAVLFDEYREILKKDHPDVKF